MMRFLRNRLIAATLAASLLILVVVVTLVYGMIRAALLAEFDETLLTKAKSIAALAEVDEGHFELEMDQIPNLQPDTKGEYFQISDVSGKLLARSPTMAEDSLGFDGARDGLSFRFTTLPDARPGRQVSLLTPIRTDLDERKEPRETRQNLVRIAVARSTLDFDRALARLAMLLVSVTLAASLLAVAVLTLVVRFTLRPIETLAAQIASIDATNVSRSASLACSIAELDPVVDRLNDLLARLDAAIGREKAFTADVAHELRTPLAGLSAALEVCGSRPRDETAYQEVISKCLHTTRSMQKMVENLLSLARADAGQLTLQKESLDLCRTIKECWCTWKTEAAERQLTSDWRGCGECIEVAIDGETLRLVLRNLFENAVRHSDRGGTVTITVDQHAEAARVEICNTGCTLAPEEAERVFERFWKKDAVRTEGSEHCGLGLPLCRRIVNALGGSINVSLENGSFAVNLRLPLAVAG